MRLLPREEKFFRYFLDQAALACEAARTLHNAVQKGNSFVEQAAADIRVVEEKGDNVIHEILTKLNSTFITPIDPEDIHSLASHLDDVTDGIEEAAYRISAYRVEPIPPAVVEMCGILVACTEALRKAFECLEASKPLLDHCIEVNRLEGQADSLYRTSVAALFQHATDAIQLIKLKEVYEIIEKTTDYCEDVADVLQSVIVKNS